MDGEGEEEDKNDEEEGLLRHRHCECVNDFQTTNGTHTGPSAAAYALQRPMCLESRDGGSVCFSHRMRGPYLQKAVESKT